MNMMRFKQKNKKAGMAASARSPTLSLAAIATNIIKASPAEEPIISGR